MNKYEAQEFINAIRKKQLGTFRCPFCGSTKFSSAPSVANILISENIDSIKIGPRVPCGMIVCKNCGHIEFFALGVLGLLQKTETENNGEEKKQ